MTSHPDDCPICGNASPVFHLACRDTTVSQRTFDLVRCTACDFVWTQNPPSPDEIGRYYQSEDYIAHTDTREGWVNRLFHVGRNWMLGRKRRLIRKFHPGDGRKLLDIGCGTGYFLAHMRDKGWQVAGVEPGDGARAFARSVFGLDILPSEALDHFPSGQFDVITLWHALEHIHDLNGAAARCRNLLREDGLLVIALPNRNSWDANHYGSPWAAWDVPRHLWHFSPETFRIWAKKNGLSLFATKRMMLDAFYISMLSERTRSRLLAPALGLISGLISNGVALWNKDRCSSLIYLLRKKP
ncbi:MAG TPA: class I SAM-dependent methyltransferase [bacterium]|nr:class I SAM-dependent methyltransferase [bacterium]